MCRTSPLATGALLQRHFVVVYDSVVRFWPLPTPLLSIAPLRDCWFAVGVLDPQEGRLQQRGVLSVRIGLNLSHATSPSRARLKCLRAVSTLIVKVFHRGLEIGYLRLLRSVMRTAVRYDSASYSDASFLHCSHAF